VRLPEAGRVAHAPEEYSDANRASSKPPPLLLLLALLPRLLV
jgi:hypothetical protein